MLDTVPWTIVGIDCASQDQHIGLARGALSSAGLHLEHVQAGATREQSVVATLAPWLQAPRVLLAIDAPLGWPSTLADALHEHLAGQPISGDATRLVRRATDWRVAALLGKTPLDVAADRIAYAGHRALRLLGELRERTQLPLPLLWSPGGESGAIEVYPAATMLSRGLDIRGYKHKQKARREAARTSRARLLAGLGDELGLPAAIAGQIVAATREDMFDAAVCVLAGADFLRGEAGAPTAEEQARARREGWIWFRTPEGGKRGGRAGS